MQTIMSLVCCVALCSTTIAEADAIPNFMYSVTKIPVSLQQKMRQTSWHPGCPVAFNRLRLIHLSYWGFDQRSHQGVLIVNAQLTRDVITVFKALYDQRFPIERMQLIEQFDGNDERSMLANNTSAFNCRAVTGMPGLFSQHSYGRAIDINPLLNPYVKGKSITPPQGKRYFEERDYPGKITKDSVIYREFTRLGWDWGGNWLDVQDYQHFEKRANHEKRNPHGYAQPQP